MSCVALPASIVEPGILGSIITMTAKSAPLTHAPVVLSCDNATMFSGSWTSMNLQCCEFMDDAVSLAASSIFAFASSSTRLDSNSLMSSLVLMAS